MTFRQASLLSRGLRSLLVAAGLTAALAASAAPKIPGDFGPPRGQPIKAVGEFTVLVRLHPEVSATVTVKVVAA